MSIWRLWDRRMDEQRRKESEGGIAPALSKVLAEPVTAYVIVAQLGTGELLKTWWKPGGMKEEEANAWLVEAVFGKDWREKE